MVSVLAVAAAMLALLAACPSAPPAPSPIVAPVIDESDEPRIIPTPPPTIVSGYRGYSSDELGILSGLFKEPRFLSSSVMVEYAFLFDSEEEGIEEEAARAVIVGFLYADSVASSLQELTVSILFTDGKAMVASVRRSDFHDYLDGKIDSSVLAQRTKRSIVPLG